jgi:hypothetical protein
MSAVSIEEFSRLVVAKIPSHREWRWTWETVVECYEQLARKTADPKHYTLACIELKWNIYFGMRRGRNQSSQFTHDELVQMHRIIVESFRICGDSIPDYRELADARIMRPQFCGFAQAYKDIMRSEITLCTEEAPVKGNGESGVYALWRYGGDHQLRSVIPSYIGKSCAREGMLTRVGGHFSGGNSWWDHPLMGITFTTVTENGRAVKDTEKAMYSVIRPPANREWYKQPGASEMWAVGKGEGTKISRSDMDAQ